MSFKENIEWDEQGVYLNWNAITELRVMLRDYLQAVGVHSDVYEIHTENNVREVLKGLGDRSV
jgi:hypothetical protein